MKTLFEMIKDDFTKIRELLKHFLLEHSSIVYRPFNLNDPGFIVVRLSDYYWGELDNDGKQKQAYIYKEYNRLLDLCNVLISDLPPNSIQEFKENEKVVLNCIEQNSIIWESSTQEVYLNVEKSLNIQLKI